VQFFVSFINLILFLLYRGFRSIWAELTQCEEAGNGGTGASAGIGELG
jgi:hypothetical protein